MPEGIYLDSNIMPPNVMAAKMNELIHDIDKYYDLFKWHDHYSFSFSGETRYIAEMCRLCAFLNNNKHTISVVKDIAVWWNEGWPADLVDPDDTQNGAEIFLTKVLNLLDPD